MKVTFRTNIPNVQCVKPILGRKFTYNRSMTPLAFTFLTFVCSIFVTTSETTNHAHAIIDELYNDDIHEVNPKLAHLYGKRKYTDNLVTNEAVYDHRQPTGLRHYNVNTKDKKKNNDDLIYIPEEFHKTKIQDTSKLSNIYKQDIDINHVNFEEATETTRMKQYKVNARRKRETNTDPRCQSFTYSPGNKRLTHPKDLGDKSKPGEGKYSSKITCFTTIEAEPGQVIELTFVDVFEIEDSPKCVNDYLEIRNGRFGYALPVHRHCGRHFPPQITSTGPYMWLKFHADDIIEYAGFTIEIDFPPKTTSKAIDHSCYKRISGKFAGFIDGTSDSRDLQTCRDQTSGPLDVQWRIETDPGTQIYLNITKFQLANTNNCTKNTLQIFGPEPNFDHLLGEYCSSVAKSLWTEVTDKHPGPTNIMYIRFFTTDRKSNFSAEFTKLRSAKDCYKKEFSCNDGTCIDKSLLCDNTANCRLQADEDPTDCKGEAQSLVRDTDTRTILIVFSLILSGMIFVFLFKCTRKFYNDQKQINEHRAQLNQYLNKAASQITLEPKSRDYRESPGSGSPSLLQQNHANERNRHQQKSSSLESDFLRIPIDDDWAESVPILADDRPKYKGRPTRDLSGKEETLRGKGSKDEKESRDVAVGAQELQEAECQTRESLYQTAPIVPRAGVSAQKSVSDSRTSGAGPPSPTPTIPKLTVELLRQATAQETSSSQADGRPLSSESTKSAPDVIQIY